jgi:acyl-[acyl-carrier-protein]-phospholipid O-acyltransferase/long-chain-fatty-acid--[acyl-carrier-protein] ligase
MSEDEPAFKPSRHQWAGYWFMIVQQTQNAFNDKMAQFILIPLAGAVGYLMPVGGGRHMDVESAAGLMIALPFVLFAPLAGWLSDRFSKRDVMLGSAVLQLLVLGLLCLAVHQRNLALALAGFFLLAVQSAFFSPAKIGMNKELLGSRHLGMAAGIQQMMAMLAILAGQIVAGWWFDERLRRQGEGHGDPWLAAYSPMLWLAACAAPALLLAWGIPRVPAQGGGKFTARVAVSHFAHLRELWRMAPLRRGALGIAFFWGFASFINLWSVKLAKEITGGGEGFGTISSMFMAAASLGMAAGFGFAAWLLRRSIELGWVPLAGLAMAAASLVLARIPPGEAAVFLDLYQSPGGARNEWLFLGVLGLLAFCSAVFLAPLNAWMQDNYPAEKRGEMQAAVNLLDCLAGIIAVLLIAVIERICSAYGLGALDGFRIQMIFVAICCLAAAVLMIRVLPADFIRVIGVALVRSAYHIRTVRVQRVPAKGGVLLLPNHVTYADAFFISAACPRPVRFVMDEAFTANPAVRAFTSIFATVNIRREQPLDAIRETISALKNGDVVCLFPEGQLTRTGTLCPLQRGFELIAKKAGQPVIPVWCDGSWGSIYSFERNRFFRKQPRRFGHGITVAFGEPLAPGAIDLEAVQAAMLTASAEALARRFAARSWSARKARPSHHGAGSFNAADSATRRRWWANGHQIGMINALPRAQAFHVLRDDPLALELPGLATAFPALFEAKVRLHDDFDGGTDGVWVGGDVLRHAIKYSQITANGLVFYDFSSAALNPVERAGLCHCACLALDGVVIAMSMPDPPPSDAGLALQRGRKKNAWGRLLPGWRLDRDESTGRLTASGPAASAGGIPLPAGCRLDEEGFLASC